ncbi:thiol disulfide exchange role in cytochrome c biogenesis [Salibacterium salarium]|uniref:Thiol disulfide exchange role in cytochrome c biogenesis n=1 Tax=Salibacterium salarium TaxID=284579 RepID=A0A3R9P415_9BACI|nr:redoxin domain-containing protein [Salibacterium salarium]RSL29839.1 thiol disulfide exchange role in cytochrome c biogenesis [Salibacterium salarium]
MIKIAVIGILLAGMLGWAFYDAMSTEESAPTEENSASNPPSEEDFESMEEQAEKQGDMLEEGDPAPDFELETLDGETMSLSQMEGSPVLINFWATWCPPCRAEMPDMQTFYEENDIEVLAVNLTDTESGQSAVSSFVEEMDLTFPVLLDKDVSVAGKYNIQPVPTSFFIDSEGIIQHISIGAMNEDIMNSELEQFE